MDKEQFFIDCVTDRQNRRFIGDDGAVIGTYVYLQDAFLEDVHFKTGWMRLRQIAAKSLLVNISDAIAMNAQPRYFLISIGIPKHYNAHDLSELAEGFRETAQQYGAVVIGGDTVSNSKLDISVTLIAQSSRPLYRQPIRQGDYIAYTGSLGSGANDLKTALRTGRLPSHSKMIKPEIRNHFMSCAARHIGAAMDISDGLFFELQRLSKMNRTGFRWLKAITRQIGCSGEEYELLFAFSPRKMRTIRRAAKRSRTPVTVVARAKRGRYVHRCRSHHF